MGSKIKRITIIAKQGVEQYEIHKEYNGLLLEKIEDKSIEYQDSMEVIYIGYTKENDFVFEVINAPIEVAYEAIL